MCSRVLEGWFLDALQSNGKRFWMHGVAVVKAVHGVCDLVVDATVNDALWRVLAVFQRICRSSWSCVLY